MGNFYSGSRQKLGGKIFVNQRRNEVFWLSDEQRFDCFILSGWTCFFFQNTVAKQVELVALHTIDFEMESSVCRPLVKNVE